MITVHKRTARRFLAAMAAGAILAGTGIGYAAHAQADSYVPGCERVDWGFLASGYRTICDGPKRPDGSWDRTRREWTPAHWAGGYCNFGRYYSSCTPRYFVEESTQRLETYPVSDAPGAENQPLPNEPGWLSSGTVAIR